MRCWSRFSVSCGCYCYPHHWGHPLQLLQPLSCDSELIMNNLLDAGAAARDTHLRVDGPTAVPLPLPLYRWRACCLHA